MRELTKPVKESYNARFLMCDYPNVRIGTDYMLLREAEIAGQR